MKQITHYYRSSKVYVSDWSSNIQRDHQSLLDKLAHCQALSLPQQNLRHHHHLGHSAKIRECWQISVAMTLLSPDKLLNTLDASIVDFLRQFSAPVTTADAVVTGAQPLDAKRKNKGFPLCPIGDCQILGLPISSTTRNSIKLEIPIFYGLMHLRIRMPLRQQAPSSPVIPGTRKSNGVTVNPIGGDSCPSSFNSKEKEVTTYSQKNTGADFASRNKPVAALTGYHCSLIPTLVGLKTILTEF